MSYLLTFLYLSSLVNLLLLSLMYLSQRNAVRHLERELSDGIGLDDPTSEEESEAPIKHPVSWNDAELWLKHLVETELKLDLRATNDRYSAVIQQNKATVYDRSAGSIVGTYQLILQVSLDEVRPAADGSRPGFIN